ncbi:MAG: DNA gyrase inhibitor YacG [Formosimonas sp.]
MPLVSCPTCDTRHEYDTRSAHRPFCSERCKLIDLGAWSQESYKIPVQPSQELPADEID